MPPHSYQSHVHVSVPRRDVYLSTMAYKLNDNLRTGVAYLDEDHDDLVENVNGIADAEKAGSFEALLRRLAAFKNDLAEHFRDEENLLRELRYPKAAAHSRHHAEVIFALDRLICDVEAGAAVTGEIAATCYHELVSTVLLRDMEFVNWLADQQIKR